ncbi:MAG: DUF1674 domain-containing protein [Hyphococcus sp.]
MSTDRKNDGAALPAGETSETAARQDLPPAAVRALQEAEARRAAQSSGQERPVEKGGPKGAEPTRYGDWERGGRAVDF